jgi:hypothetical protein
MSADNFIAIQKIKKRWFVWMAFAPENEEHKPGGSFLRKFKKHKTAWAYAQGLLAGLGVVEYGIIEYPSKGEI